MRLIIKPLVLSLSKHDSGEHLRSPLAGTAARGKLFRRIACVTIATLLCFALAACTHLPTSWKPPSLASQPHLVALDAESCRAMLRDDAPVASLQQAAARSVEYLQRVPQDRLLPVLDRQIAVAELLPVIAALAAGTSAGDDWSQQVCGRFRLYRADLPQSLLVTGYYEPQLAASRRPSARFRYPVYRVPDDLVDVDVSHFCPECRNRVAQGRVENGKLVPYYSRGEIEAGVLAERGYEIAWLDDPVEAFFLHVQGSAELRFEDGVHMQISYSSSNGRPYTSLGSVLIEEGRMSRDSVSLQALKDYLRAHPDEQAALTARNQRYIFFRTVAAGPIGSLGVPLTAGRSIAADPSVYPPGGLAFVRVARRDARTAESAQPLVSRFALIQDAGTAIAGPNRLDVFWGSGATAEAVAGDMRNPGELYVVLPR
ncbi:MAG: transglycosylase [Deltaproteobacteria bacterium]|nr:transglycosylase [Deltaproteobacteria bacterium]